MKKRLLSILLTACLAFGGVALMAGCGSADSGSADTVPETKEEYVQWLIDHLKTTYNVSGSMRYVPNDSSMKDEREFIELDNMDTTYDGYVTKNGGATVSTMRAITRNYASGPSETVSDVKVEFTQNDGSYSKKVYDDSKRVAATTSLNESQFEEETTSLWLPEALLKYCASHIASVDLHPNTAPSKYKGMSLSEAELKNYTILNYFGGHNSTYSSNSENLELEIVVYKNKLSHVEFVAQGTDDDDNSYYHTGAMVYDNTTDNPRDVFDKTGYYSSVEERATEIFNGVLNNLPTTFQVVQTDKTVLSDYTSPANTSYFAYEKSGNTIYYYIKNSRNGDWVIAETYTENGEGHIGRVYDKSTNTYSEHVCDKELCLYTNNDPDPQKLEQHVFINSTDTSFALWEKFLEMMDEATIEFGEDGECILAFEQVQDDETFTTTLTIKDNKIKKMVLETTNSEFPPIPNVTAGGTAVATVTVTYTYDTAAIDADLSGYSKAE